MAPGVSDALADAVAAAVGTAGALAAAFAVGAADAFAFTAAAGTAFAASAAFEPSDESVIPDNKTTKLQRTRLEVVNFIRFLSAPLSELHSSEPFRTFPNSGNREILFPACG